MLIPAVVDLPAGITELLVLDSPPPSPPSSLFLSDFLLIRGIIVFFCCTERTKQHNVKCLKMTCFDPQ